MDIFGLRRIIDMAYSKKDYVLKCVGNARQVRENLMKILFIDDERNYKHWKQELVTHFINMIDTKISGDSKSNSKREKVLTTLLIESPYGKGEDFVYNSLAVANCAFADEGIETYDCTKLEEELNNIRDEILVFFKTLVLLQNSDKVLIRSRLYNMLDDLTTLVTFKVSRK